MLSILSDISVDRSFKEKFELKNIPFIILGLVGIIFGGELVVDSATKIAEMLHIGHDVIALTVIAIGT